MIVAVAQPPCRPGDVAANVHAHAAAVLAADARVVVFPELSLTGYELDAPPVAPEDLQPIVEACAATGAIALVGAPLDRFIAMLRVDGEGATVVYRKSHPGGDELDRFAPGDGPTVITVDGHRLGLGICKDTGVDEHTAGTAALGIDVYVAGLVHFGHELAEQDARGQRIAAACGAFVAFASAAGPAGGPYDLTAGESTILGPDGSVLARAGSAPGAIARARIGVSEMRAGGTTSLEPPKAESRGS